MKIKKVILFLILLPAAINFAQVDSYPVHPDYVEAQYSFSKLNSKLETVRLTTDEPAKIMILLISIPGHPGFGNRWPEINNPDNYPNENWPLLGTLPNGQLLRDFISDENNGPVPADYWYKNQIEEYYRINSNGKYEVEVIFPKAADGRVYKTERNFSDWVEINNNERDGFVTRFNNWKNMAVEVMEKIYEADQSAFEEISLINLVYLVHRDEYTTDNYSAYSFDIPTTFISEKYGMIYSGYVVTTYTMKVILHETLHRIGSMVGEPEGFEGLPDRTTLPLLSLPENMTWGYDVMYNKGFFPSENALYGAPPMLTIDRMFFEWIEPDEVLTVDNTDIKDIKLKDVNLSLSDEDKADGFYRVAKVMIRKDFNDELDEYFLLEFRNGTGFDRNFYNIYEPEPHNGLLVWHVKENAEMLNRTRQFDHHIDLEVAVPYNGWHGSPIPDDGFPRNYSRPFSWKQDVNAAGDYDYYDDSSSNPPYPDGGVHRWELTDDTHPEWAPYYVRRNTLRTNFFTDDTIRGVVTKTMSNHTRPSTKNWGGYPTNIVIDNVRNRNDYMLVDVYSSGGVLSTDENNTVDNYRLEPNYPNPFNAETTIRYSIPEEADVEITITNMLGQVLHVPISEVQPAGNHSVVFDASELPSGFYFYTLKSNNFVKTRKMILLK